MKDFVMTVDERKTVRDVLARTGRGTLTAAASIFDPLTVGRYEYFFKGLPLAVEVLTRHAEAEDMRTSIKFTINEFIAHLSNVSHLLYYLADIRDFSNDLCQFLEEVECGKIED